jgi:DNA-binding response OmpR family regulator
MATRYVKVLHVEDDQFQRHLIARHLGTMREFEFTIHCVEAEDIAIRTFRASRFDLVILDYYLKEGNGSSCLYRLRLIDAIVPVIAISGGATRQIISELFELGADAYINKRDLKCQMFTQNVRDAMARSDAWRQSLSLARNQVGGVGQVESRLAVGCE